MLSILKVRADRRVAISAAVIGTGLGLGLGAAYLGAGAAQADHQRAARLAAAYGYSEQALDLQASGFAPGAAAIARRHDPFPLAGDVTPPPAALPGQVVKVQISYGTRLRGSLPALAPEPVRKVASSDARQVECLTQAVYFEARGEGASGQAAVAQVVMNRVHHPAFPKSICGVVYQGAGGRGGCQFSFACDGSADRGHDLVAWRRAHGVAVRAMSGVVAAGIGQATHFHTVNVSPDWGPRLMRVAQVGMHVFYQFGHGAGAGMAAAHSGAPTRTYAKPSPDLPVTPDFRLASAVLVNPGPITVAPSLEKAAPPAPAPEAEDAAVRLLNTP